ncbi:MAG: hypothetical protein JW751_02875 [Polyangiaceae bacterium]|nr:hypothetical protein [Polyangiaceae bacterium]
MAASTVELRDRAMARGDVVSGANVVRGNRTVIQGVKASSAEVGLQTIDGFQWPAFPPVAQPLPEIQPDQFYGLAPGRFDRLIVKSRSEV